MVRQLLLHRALHSVYEPSQGWSPLHPTMTFLSAENKHLSQHHQQSHPHQHSLLTRQPINKLTREAFREKNVGAPHWNTRSSRHASISSPRLSSNTGKNALGSAQSNVMVSVTDKVQVVNFMLMLRVETFRTNYHECGIDWYENCQLLSTSTVWHQHHNYQQNVE